MHPRRRGGDAGEEDELLFHVTNRALGREGLPVNGV
jgi:hypothetical protein